MANKLRIGIAGLGVGRSHASAFEHLSEYFELAGFCDLDEMKSRQLSEMYQVPFATTRFEDMLEREDIDVIDICTPSSQHFDQVMAALAAGKHVICEKPLVGSLLEVDRIRAAEGRSGKCVMPVFQYRFGHGIQKLRYLIDQGAAGRLYLSTVETHWRRRENYYASPWRGRWATEMGGTLVTHAIHEHDLLSFIAGPVRSVYARTATRVHPIEVDDCASISMEMADGSLAVSSATVGSSEQISRLRFCFSALSAESGTEPYNNSDDPWRFTPDSPEDAQRIAGLLEQYLPQPEGYEGQFLRFAAALIDGGTLPVTLDDARASIELLTAIYASVWSGGPVNLPIPDDHPMASGWAKFMKA